MANGCVENVDGKLGEIISHEGAGDYRGIYILS